MHAMKRSMIALAALFAVAGLAPAQAPARPNILVIVLDDLGTERLRMYGQGTPFASTPALNQLAQNGIVFTNAYVNPLCGPSRAAMQCGRYGFRTGFGPNIFPDFQFDLASNEVYIPEMLRDGFAPAVSPYARAAFGKWHISLYANLTHPNDNGYQHFSGCISNVGDPVDVNGQNIYHHYFWRKLVDGSDFDIGSANGPFTEATWSGSVCRVDASRWINAQTQPFFAWVAFNPPHGPHQVPPFTLLSPGTRTQIEQLGLLQTGTPYGPGDIAGIGDLTDPVHPLSSSQLAAKRMLFYAAMIEATDRDIGKLLTSIPTKIDDTMVIVIGDNGSEPSVIDPARFNPLHGKRSTYQLGTRVPMIVSGPLVASPGRTCSGLVGAVDLWRTVREISGAREPHLPAGTTIDSVSFLPLITDPSAHSARRYAMCETFNPNGPQHDPNTQPNNSRTRAINDGRWKYMRKTVSDIEELYDLQADPNETHNLLPPTTDEEWRHYGELKGQLDALLHSGN